MNFPGTIRRVRSSLFAALFVLFSSVALAGHDNIEVDPALKRYAGQITELGMPDAKGDVYSFRAKRIRAETEFDRDELRGWRLTSSPASASPMSSRCAPTPATRSSSRRPRGR